MPTSTAFAFKGARRGRECCPYYDPTDNATSVDLHSEGINKPNACTEAQISIMTFGFE
ncbi:hypothetical protein K449DRAFT_392242 [Hypoxylon sp. EC38]|nr:hypothetical protein K449DRAFT_392242 [Hypoxylon sp. EC38]